MKKQDLSTIANAHEFAGRPPPTAEDEARIDAALDRIFKPADSQEPALWVHPSYLVRRDGMRPMAIDATLDQIAPLQIPLFTAAPVQLTVWYGPMPESNGKTNWTAILHRKDQCMSEGITIDRSEYPERVRYEADCMRFLIGELKEEPWILDYDESKHSGYVKPVEWGSPKTIRQLIAQLKTLDQDLEPFAMLRIPDYKDNRQVKAVPLIFSHERVDGHWLSDFKGNGRKVIAFWVKADPREQPEGEVQ